MSAISTAAHGDFQTPAPLARQVCDLLRRRMPRVGSIVEPTCGLGSFLFAALDAFPEARRAVAVEINPAHVAKLRDALCKRGDAGKVSLECGSFFDRDWPAVLATLPEPILLVGNPPWVTNAALGRLGSSNLPVKANFQHHRGLDALTGKSNFDISEWMLVKLIDLVAARNAFLAMLCKRSSARKTLGHAWRCRLPVTEAAIFGIDAGMHFDAAVEACLLFLRLGDGPAVADAQVHEHLAYARPTGSIGYRDGLLIANTVMFDRWRRLLSGGGAEWRSGIKHDCSAVMELTQDGSNYVNGLGERIELEDACVYPMLKSSDVAREESPVPRRWMLVPQRAIGEDTSLIQHQAPKTWSYLQSHRERFHRRASAVYRNRPPFSIFGVGEYSFAPWKVAISGLYKSLDFRLVGPASGKPVVFDDTCYFLPCATEQEARAILDLLCSDAAQQFLNAMIFWDAKRPITVDVLRRLDLAQLADVVGLKVDSRHAARQEKRMIGPAAEPEAQTLFG